MALNLLIMSDLHVEFAPFVPDPAATATADVVVLAGDIHKGTAGIAWARQSFADKAIVYVAGNHEFYGHDWDGLLDQLREAGRTYDVNFLEDESVTIAGIRFLGCTLWTDFNYFGVERRTAVMREAQRGMNDYHMIKARQLPDIYWRSKSHRLTAWHTVQRHIRSRAWLQEQLAAGDPARTVAVVHHYFHLKSTPAEYAADPLTAAFGSHLPPDMLTKAKLWIHGHTHTEFDYRLEAGDLRVLCNPRGYPLDRGKAVFENSAFNPALLVQVETG